MNFCALQHFLLLRCTFGFNFAGKNRDTSLWAKLSDTVDAQVLWVALVRLFVNISSILRLNNRMDNVYEEEEAMFALEIIRYQVMNVLMVVYLILQSGVLDDETKRRCYHRYSLLARIPAQIEHLHGLVKLNEQDCIDQLRLGRNAFAKLCLVLEHRGGLRATRGVSVAEEVAMFLSVLSHHQKLRVVKKSFIRSIRTVSRHFHRVLNAVLRCYELFVVKPVPIEEDCEDERWKWFKGCLGALDGTYVPVKVCAAHQARYRSRKGIISVNTLAVCDRNLNFIYVLTGWEGSAADGRVLRDAIHRPNGLRVPRGNYYLCDAGYTNGEGFLAPYRGVRYHLTEWGSGNARAQNYKELFNLRHSKARNVIERAFGVLKVRWGVLRSPSFYPIEIQNKIILACCLLHNFIRLEMIIDPLEAEVPEEPEVDETVGEYVEHIQSTQEWNNWRDNLAQTMYNEWPGRR